MSTLETSLDRRQLLSTGAALTLAATLSGELLANEHGAHSHHDQPAPNAALVAATRDCIDKGQACLSHCLALFRSGDTSLAVCASSVSEMLPLSTALSQLAALGSTHIHKLAAVCIDACQNCEAECRKHADKHASCQAMAEACAACIKACKALG
ncbi:four-helix bundle copper-binding protein [Candidatus Magnetaquicoccus inordinatus]|uniref:four-helix bundle copper-binding protein n=1 Tax=Candidatus Magnetaquicoccus inordinatus TaxID=2496818 RepID=UPI001D0F1B05|nr:four-helix bundle copper-binding protein [Candidatus Magnetaquicoccus inordinatus]